PVLRARLGLGLETPVELAPAHQIGEAGRNRDPEVLRLAAGLEQQHPVTAGGRQSVGEDAAGGAAADDDVVVGFHDQTVGSIGAPMKAAISAIWQASIGLP